MTADVILHVTDDERKVGSFIDNLLYYNYRTELNIVCVGQNLSINRENIQVINNRIPVGLPTAINQGSHFCTSNFIFYFDYRSNFFMDHDFISKALDFLESNQDIGIAGNVLNISISTQRPMSILKRVTGKVDDKEWFKPFVSDANSIVAIAKTMFVLRKSAIESIGELEEIDNSVVEFSWRCLANKLKVGKLNGYYDALNEVTIPKNKLIAGNVQLINPCRQNINRQRYQEE